MARVAITPQAIVRTGLNATYTAALADGHGFTNSGRKKVIHVKNGGAGATVVTIPTPGTIDGLAIPDRTVSVPAGEDRFIGPFSELYENDDSGGDTGISDAVFINTDVQTSVTYAVLYLSTT